MSAEYDPAKGAPFPYADIDTAMIAGYSDEKLLRQVSSQDWINGKGGYGYVAELCKRLVERAPKNG